MQVSESRNLTAAIRANNGNVKYSEYENVGHNVWLNALGEKELLPWLLAQKARIKFKKNLAADYADERGLICK